MSLTHNGRGAPSIAEVPVFQTPMAKPADIAL